VKLARVTVNGIRLPDLSFHLRLFVNFRFVFEQAFHESKKPATQNEN